MTAFVAAVGWLWPVLGFAQTADIDVFILAGQSNMSGYGRVDQLGAPYNAKQDDVLFWWGAAMQEIEPGITYTTANHYHWHDLQAGRGIRGKPNFGPELSFGRKLADEMPGRRIAVIKHALGGTNLAYDWNPDPNVPRLYPQYDLFKNEVHNAIGELKAAGFNPIIRAMGWMQGESDALAASTFNAGNPNTYQANLQGLIAAVREEFDMPEMQFIIGRIQNEQPDAPHNAVVRAAQVQVGESVQNADWIDTDDLALFSDRLHYNNEGLIDLGERFAEAYLATVPEPAGGLMAAVGCCVLATRRIVRA